MVSVWNNYYPSSIVYKNTVTYIGGYMAVVDFGFWFEHMMQLDLL
jgi:hypothetical protein